MSVAQIQARPPQVQTPARRVAPPCAFVVFGATGDLTRRKLMPAIYKLMQTGSLSDAFALVGVSRRPFSREAFAQAMIDAVKETGEVDAPTADRLGQRLDYVTGEFSDAATYTQLRQRLEQADRDRGTEGNRLFYLATPPSEFETILTQLKQAGLIVPPHGKPWTRVVIEKPFGRDLTSAQELNRMVAGALDESQTFRIDHYLGKETVQNILVFRFANSIFEPLWNQKYIDHVQITVAEEEGLTQRDPHSGEITGSRVGYYEGVGALRDMVQNHILQVCP